MQAIELGFLAQLVMPGLVPGIHVLLHLNQKKTWMAGTRPAMTKSESFSSSWKEPENAGRFFSQALSTAARAMSIMRR